MKKITALFLVVLALLPLSACAGDSISSSSTPSLTAQEPSSEASSEQVSTQEPTATPAASATPEPASEPTSQPEPTPEPDSGYNDGNSRTSIEMNDPNSRPAISGSVEDMGQYDVVFVGYPIWWGDAPHILYTFMESYDWSGKTVIPFCTSGGSGIGSSATNLESLAPGASWTAGRRFSASVSQDELVQWANSLVLGLTDE